MEPGIGELDTFPKLLMMHARIRGARPAIREKDLGIWQTWTWHEFAEEVRALACGLAEQGFKRGDHLALVSDNRPRLYAAMCAAQCLGGVPVPLYQDAVAAEMGFPIQNAEISHAFAEDQEQVDKLLEILPQCPTLRHIYYDDPRGMRHYAEGVLASYESLRDRGRAAYRRDPAFLESEIAKGRGEDAAAMLFTSGTTATPKGVVLTHHALIDRARAAAELERLDDRDVALAYLPPAWVGQFIFSLAQPFVTGYCICCPESPETVMTDMREIGPTYYFAPPRVLEALLTQVSIRMEDASRVKRWLYARFMAIAQRVGGALLDGKPVGALDRLLYRLGDLVVYGPLRNVLGMSRVRVAYTAGEAIGPDLFKFYRSIGINLKQLYGSTETSVFVCVQPDGQVKPDTVGPAVRGVELKFTPERELLIRSPGLFKEYYKNPQATLEAKDAEGWFHTGDAGYVDADGHLKIIDRVKDVGRLSDGTLFAPKYLENKLKFFPYVKEAVCFGQARDTVCAFVNIDMEAVGNWAERRNLAYSGFTDLALRDEVYELVRGCVERVNADLAQDPELANSQIHRFLILHKDLDPDDEELTRTRKVRRGFIAEKYAALVEALYSGRKDVHIEAQVRYEDGRTGTFSADLKIRDARTFASAAARKAA
ncbi:MAG: long-chain fatty acid--CoA ligase [Betaproteobacteria bacterium RIFCSPHIGHO2_12_FULL_69_13]|nr:MAG: long-chain fatty acid--CoA ligase [Betaproteobacteria bacterium RIFCSPHIGHO2_12_FULL_69_13]OGA65702.1 MAG: long-chain fatty acid--CoA ligase [Betaproteobacteria bacterium RIFCSPLOWO2_12_FULL_68_20]